MKTSEVKMDELTVNQKVRVARRAIERLMADEAQEVEAAKQAADLLCAAGQLSDGQAGALELAGEEKAAVQTVRRFRAVLRALHLTFATFADVMEREIRIELKRGTTSIGLEQFTFTVLMA